MFEKNTSLKKYFVFLNFYEHPKLADKRRLFAVFRKVAETEILHFVVVKIRVEKPVMKNLNTTLEIWNQSSELYPSTLKIVAPEEKERREKQCKLFVQQTKRTTKTTKLSVEDIRKRKAEMLRLLSDFFRHTLGYSDEELQTLLSDEMLKSTWSFLKAAKTYDSSLRIEDAFQALRNVWILNGLQLIGGLKIELTPSIVAYSMLYPYTDNYLDDREITATEKMAFGIRFAARIAGEELAAENPQEEKIFEMIEFIEGEWPRSRFPQVYQSLLDIHEAQSDSVRLIKGVADLDFEQRLAICIHKGGASVVADGMLLLGQLSTEQEEFLYAYGAYLQLLDDWQDLTEDRESGVLTAFAYASKEGDLDHLISKCWHMGQQIIRQADVMDSPQVPLFQSLMQKSIDMFLVEAVQGSSTCFSKEFVAQMEAFSPVRFEFIQKKKTSVSPFQNQLVKQLITPIFANSDADEFSFLHKKSPERPGLDSY